jgi:tetratricopeptide (TPR) repeat protein
MQAQVVCACITFFRVLHREYLESRLRKMCSNLKRICVFAALGGLSLSGFTANAQQSKVASPRAQMSPQQAIALGEQGQCRESISALKKAEAPQVPAEIRKHAGVVGVRCALSIDDRNAALKFISALNREFGQDPDVLYVIVHAYSDLSTRTAQDLARTAPQSIAAHKLNAEALEEQGRWQPAELEYEWMIHKDPSARGTHFLLGRLLLSEPNAGPDVKERAKQEFLKEIQIDPGNVDAHFILGELAREDQNWGEAISRFSQAAKLNPDFAEAYLGWGVSLIGDKKYQDAIPPLRIAERLTPANPDIHNALGTALVRTGHKEEAEKEFAIHRSLGSGVHPGASAGAQPE